jgi:CBS domain-containing protein
MIRTNVEDVMTQAVETVSSETAAMDAASHLRRRGVGSLVVLADGELAGIVTESDFVALVGEDASTATPVSAFMSSPLATTTPETALADAAETMRAEGVRRLPVVDDGVLVGVVTTTDLSRYLPEYQLEVGWDGKPLGERRKVIGTAIGGVEAGD